MIPVLDREHLVSEVSLPGRVTPNESTDTMLKTLRAANGGTLDANKLSLQEKIAIDKNSHLLTKKEQNDLDTCFIKQMIETKTCDFD